MGTGWRRAFCTSVPRDKHSIDDEHQAQIPPNSSPQPLRSCVKLGFFSGELAGAPSADNTPVLRCKTAEKKPRSPREKLSTSNPSTPRSPFSILKSSLRLSKNRCGVCLQSAKIGQGAAIFTAECSHSFHFHCISNGIVVCPVCNRAWKDVPLFSVREKTHPSPEQTDVVEKTITVATASTAGGGHGFLTDDSRIRSSIAAVKTRQEQSRPYNDDEPLLSPVTGGRFNPIPEAEDEENEDVEEFQGFFVNSTPSTPRSTSKFIHGRRFQRNVDVKLLPESAIISVDSSDETFAVALRVKAPPIRSLSHRAPIDLVVILDLSESMTGSKLKLLKRALKLMISSLCSSDRLSIVAFSSASQRLLPLRRMSHHGQRLAHRIVDHLAVGGGKSVDSGLRTAAKILEDRREFNPVARILLLSTGDNQSGVNQRPTNSHVSVTQYGHVEVSVNDGIVDALGGLLTVVVKDVKLELGFVVGEISAVYCCNGRPRLLGSDQTRLGDLYSEEELELLVELRVPMLASGSHHVMSVRCSYRDPLTGDVVCGRERALPVPRPRAAVSSDPRTERLRTVFVATRAVAEMHRLVERGELGGAHQLLASARALVAQSGSSAVDECGALLEAEMAAMRWHRQAKADERVRERHVAVDEAKVVAVRWRRQAKAGERMRDRHVAVDEENGEEPLTPTSAWRAAEQLAKVAMRKKSLNRVSDLHGFENARF